MWFEGIGGLDGFWDKRKAFFNTLFDKI